MRMQPFLTVGALSSSGVVNAMYNLSWFDYQVFDSSNRSTIECPMSLRTLSDFVDKELQNPDRARQIKADFGAQ